MVRGDDGLWHLFYTGSRKSEEGLYQRIGHATSRDLHNRKRVGDGLCLDIVGPDAAHYEADHLRGFWHDRAMRDPWVMRDTGGEGWFTARATGVTEPDAGGAIGFATRRGRSRELNAPLRRISSFGPSRVEGRPCHPRYVGMPVCPELRDGGLRSIDERNRTDRAEAPGQPCERPSSGDYAACSLGHTGKTERAEFITEQIGHLRGVMQSGRRRP